MEGALRVGIAGAGFIGTVHALAARRAGGTVAGVAASTPERGRAAAARLGGGAAAFATAEDLVQADGIDVVHLCTPNHLHAPLARLALAAGKHVICEKPLATTLDDARDATAAALAADAPVTAVPFVYRYYPTVREARQRIADDRIGGLKLIHGTYLQDWLLTADDDNWRVDPTVGGASRAFADIGSHWCDLAEFVSGHRIARLSARTLTTVAQRRTGAEARETFSRADRGGPARPVHTEDAVTLQFETDRGALGALVVSQVSAGRKNRLWLELDGTAAALAFDQEDPEVLWLGGQDETAIIRRDPARLSPAAARLSRLPAGHPQGYQDCFDLFVADAYAAIRTGERPDGLPGFADGLRAAVLTAAVLESAREQRWVAVPVDRDPAPAAAGAGR